MVGVLVGKDASSPVPTPMEGPVVSAAIGNADGNVVAVYVVLAGGCNTHASMFGPAC